VDVCIPKIYGGCEGHCIYIDTEGSFVIERVIEIAEAAAKHVKGLAKSPEEEQVTSQSFSIENILNHIHYYRVHDYIEQVALVNLLPSIIQSHNDVRLIVIDSITFHFRHDFEDMSLRTRVLNGMAQNLMAIAEQHNIAVVLMNQMTTKVTNNESQLIPALGESWGHSCTNRIILYWKHGKRHAYLYKSPMMKADTIAYSVTSEGIR